MEAQNSPDEPGVTTTRASFDCGSYFGFCVFKDGTHLRLEGTADRALGLQLQRHVSGPYPKPTGNKEYDAKALQAWKDQSTRSIRVSIPLEGGLVATAIQNPIRRDEDCLVHFTDDSIGLTLCAGTLVHPGLPAQSSVEIAMFSIWWKHSTVKPTLDPIAGEADDGEKEHSSDATHAVVSDYTALLQEKSDGSERLIDACEDLLEALVAYRLPGGAEYPEVVGALDRAVWHCRSSINLLTENDARKVALSAATMPEGARLVVHGMLLQLVGRPGQHMHFVTAPGSSQMKIDMTISPAVVDDMLDNGAEYYPPRRNSSQR